MIFVYLKISLRQLFKRKDFLLINVIGLAVAMAACLVIWQFASYHLNFDDTFRNRANIYRVACRIAQADQQDAHVAALSAQIGPAAKAELPEVEGYARFWGIGYMNHSLIYKEAGKVKMFSEKKVYLADSSINDFFDLKFVHGNIAGFVGKHKVILSSSAATKYFSNANPVGKTVELASNMGNHEYEVVGVTAPMPGQSHLDFDVLVSFDSHLNYYENSDRWQRFNTMNYLKLAPHHDQSMLSASLQRMLDENLTSNQNGYSYDIYLEKLVDIHLHSAVTDSFKAGADATLIYALLVTTIVILTIAWMNYLNLAMVKTLDRVREIGVRRVFGSNNKQLAGLFVLESIIINIIAFCMAMTLSQLGSPYLSNLTTVPINIFHQPMVLFTLLLIAIIGAMIIGAYPLVLLKVLKTSEVLTGRRTQSVGKLELRKLMILLQFMITFILVASTITVYKQVSFMKSADLGIDIDHTLIIKSPPSDIHSDEDEGQQAFNVFKSTLTDQSFVKSITNAGEAPGEPISWRATAIRLKNAPENTGINTGLVAMGINFREFFDIKLLAGRWYRPGDSPWRKKDCVINEKMAVKLGFDQPEEAIGAEIAGFFAPIQVRGVVENYHHESLHKDFEPVIYILSDWTEYYFVKLMVDKDLSPALRLNQLRSNIATIEQVWDQVFITPMDYSFLDDKFDQQYAQDEQLGQIFGTFAVLAVFIACLGLYGMFSFYLKQKIKEIGIRKVLGAHATDLIKILTSDYVKILGFSYLLSLPLYLYLTSSWLENFTFKVDMGIWIYWSPLLLVLCVSVLSIMYRLISSIRINPTISLRNE